MGVLFYQVCVRARLSFRASDTAGLHLTPNSKLRQLICGVGELQCTGILTGADANIEQISHITFDTKLFALGNRVLRFTLTPRALADRPSDDRWRREKSGWQIASERDCYGKHVEVVPSWQDKLFCKMPPRNECKLYNFDQACEKVINDYLNTLSQ